MTLPKKSTAAHVFSCEFRKSFQKSISEEHIFLLFTLFCLIQAKL